jgi:hypothetical protein
LLMACPQNDEPTGVTIMFQSFDSFISSFHYVSML